MYYFQLLKATAHWANRPVVGAVCGDIAALFVACLGDGMVNVAYSFVAPLAIRPPK